MSDMFSASVDASGVIDLFDRMAASADFVCLEVARDTAKRIVAEAQRRAKRLTGQTSSGIHFELSRDRSGYVVLAYTEGNQPDPVDLYLEYGTRVQAPQKFFFDSARLEEGPHLKRLIDRMTEWLEEVGR